ncbi:MAG: glycosyl hydrolase [Bacteroidetes bacterium]|nr:glycosyl hydrolase [Bacteroidota bacterium]
MKRLFALLLLTAIVLPSAAQKNNQPPAAPEPKPTPAAERMAALEKRKAAEQRSLVSNIAFTNIGPTIMSGRVTDIDADPNDPTRFYVAYASGGVFFTGNNGTTFSPVFEQETSITIGDIAVNWNNAARPEIWVGTGEANSSRSSYAGTGVYVSPDGGKTWQNRGLHETHHIGKVLLHPSQNGTAWVAAIGHLYSPSAERGVYKTTDGGKTWSKALYIDENTGVIDLTADPQNPDVLYATAWHRERRAWNFVEAGAGTAIYKSTDGGKTWNIITTAASGFPQGNDIGRIGLSIFHGNTQIMYAVVDNQTLKPAAQTSSKRLSPARFRTMSNSEFLALNDTELETWLRSNEFPAQHTAASIKAQVQSGTLKPVALADFVSDANADLFNRPITGAQIYRSDNGGQSWQLTGSDENLKDLFYTYGYYFGKIWISPFDANEIWVAGVQLLHSTDGGKTFAPTDGANQHGDHHALYINPKRRGHLINGNDGGVNISWDNGLSWFKANTPAVGQFYAINVDMATPYNVYGGLQDNGVWYGPSNYEASLSWYDYGQYPYRFIYGGDGMQVMIDPRDNVTVYTGYQFGHYGRVNRLTGETAEVRPENVLGEPPLRFNWQAPIWLSVHNPDILYMGAQRLFRSMNKGDDFTAISGDLTRGGRTGDVPYGTLSTIHESPVQFGLLYTGSDDGLVHVSKNGGETWTRISDALPQHLRVNRVIASAHVKSRVYVVLSGFQWDHFAPYVFVSEDFGATWKQIATDLPHEPVNVIREDPVNPDLIFIGTDNGLYCSLNRGLTTMRMNGGLPAVAVHDIVIHPREHEILIGTHGRSIYKAYIGDLQLINSVKLSNYNTISYLNQTTNRNENQTSFSEMTISWVAPKAGTVTIQLCPENDNLILLEVKDTCEAGLNRKTLSTRLDTAEANSFREWLILKQDPRRIKSGHDGKSNLPAGRYELIFTDEKGVRFTQKVDL